MLVCVHVFDVSSVQDCNTTAVIWIVCKSQLINSRQPPPPYFILGGGELGEA